ncbi:MAG: DGQHR domain-containing protein [Candidatus Asgardarchaeia archaeon]
MSRSKEKQEARARKRKGKKRRTQAQKTSASMHTSSQKGAMARIAKSDNVSIVPDEYKNDKQSYFEIPVVMKCQKGIYYYSGELTVAQLASIVQVPNYNHHQDGEPGYQRNNTEKNGRAFGTFMQGESNICFGELMVNDRDKKVTFIPLKDMMADAPKRKLSSVVGILRIPADCTLWTYDGQTRRFGYIALLHYHLASMATDGGINYSNLTVPFCVSQLSYAEEEGLFLNHNRKQTRVSTAHSAIVDFNNNKHLVIGPNQTWDDVTKAVIAGAVTAMCDDRISPWHNLVELPDTPKGKKISSRSSSFITGMKPLVKWMQAEYWSEGTIQGVKADDLSRITTVFWSALKRACPKIWRNPDNYIMHRSLGIAGMSYLLGRMYSKFFNRDIDWNIENVYNSLKKSKTLTRPRLWENQAKISKGGGGYNALKAIAEQILRQIEDEI